MPPEDPSAPPPPDPGAPPPGAPPAPPPPAAPPGAPPAWMEGEGWTPELKGDKTLSKYKSPADLAVAHVNLQKMMGSKVDVPDVNTPPEKAQAFWSRLGVPDTPEGYTPPAIPEGYTLDENLMGGFRKLAHEVKISKEGADKLMSWYVAEELKKATGYQAEYAAEKEEGMKALRGEWGAAADQNIGLCQRVVAEFGGADVQAVLNETGVGNDPRMVKFLAKLGRVMAEDGLMTTQDLGKSSTDAQTEINKVMNDKSHAYWNESAPGHKAAVEAMARLYELVHNKA